MSHLHEQTTRTRVEDMTPYPSWLNALALGHVSGIAGLTLLGSRQCHWDLAPDTPSPCLCIRSDSAVQPKMWPLADEAHSTHIRLLALTAFQSVQVATMKSLPKESSGRTTRKTA